VSAIARRALRSRESGHEQRRPAGWDGGRWLLPVATLLTVFVLGFLAAELRPPKSTVAVWWPAAGVAVSAYVLGWRRGQRAAVLVATVLGVLAAERLADYSWAVSVGYALVNLANPVVCVGVLHRLVPTLRLADARDYARFCLAALLGALSTAVLGFLVASVLMDDSSAWNAFRAVVPSHLSAVLCIAPAVLLTPRRPAPAGRTETAVQVCTTLLVTMLVFTPDQYMQLSFLFVGFLIWGAARVSMTWVYIEVVLVAAISAAATSLGWGDYAAEVKDHDLAFETGAMLLDVTLIGIALAVYPLAMAMDVHRASLAQARESRELLDSVLAGATGNAIIGADVDGLITSWNTGAERIFGWPTTQVCGRRTLGSLRDGPSSGGVGRGLDPELARLVAPLATGKEWVDQDWECVREDGRRVTVAFRLTARRSAYGAVVGWIAVGEDVTEKRRTEGALQDALERERQAVQRFEELDTVKTSLVQSVSHELRTPMTNVLGYTDMLLGQHLGEVNASQRKMLMSVSRNGRRLLKLIEDLLTLSHIEQRAFTTVAERVDLRTAVRRGCEAVASQAEAAAVALELNLGEGPALVIGDTDQLERVTENLLGNAVKFSPAGSVVGVAVECAEGEAVLTVTDRGMGIPATEASRLFERFFRSSNAQRAEIQGSGLGLAIVKEVVDHHDGRIEVESEEGVGTTVRVRLPLQAPVGASLSARGSTGSA